MSQHMGIPGESDNLRGGIIGNYRNEECVDSYSLNQLTQAKLPLEGKMKRKTAISAPPKDVALTPRYGQIGIPAVAAAAPYRGKGKNENSPTTSRAEGKSAERKKIRRDTSSKQ
jgi:hypothetical protein